MASVKLICHGHYAKKNVVLRGIKFTNGQAELPGTYAQNEGIITYMGRVYQAYPEGMSPEEGAHNASQVPATAIGHTPKEIPGAGEPTRPRLTAQETNDGEGDGGPTGGGTGNLSTGDGQEDPRLYTRLVGALNTLDPKNDDHWTQKGLPSIQAVEQALGGGQVTRKEIEAAIPGFSREIAAGTPPAPTGEGAPPQQ